MTESKQKKAAASGSLSERPLPRLLQQLHRKKVTGYVAIIDPTKDESEVYFRDGYPVHVRRPVDTDRMDNLLVQFGVVSAEIVAEASGKVTEGKRLGDVLEEMGYLDKHKLAYVLKTQMIRKLTRLFFTADGTFAVYLEDHPFGVGDELGLMQMDYRSVLYPGIRVAYDLPRLTQELSRLIGQEFRLHETAPSFLAGMGIPPEDSTADRLRGTYFTLDTLHAIPGRPIDVRSVVLALYYADLLDRRPIPMGVASAPAVSRGTPSSAEPRSLSMDDSGPVLPSPPAPSGSQQKMEPALPPALRKPVAVPPPIPPKVKEKTLSYVAPTSAPNPNDAFPEFIPDETPIMESAPHREAPSAQARVRSSTPTVPAFSPLASRPSAPLFEDREATPIPVKLERTRGIEEKFQNDREILKALADRLDSLSYFELLSVPESASPGEVDEGFIKAARKFHPDRLQGMGLQDLMPEAERILSRMSEASMVLRDPKRRAEYIASRKPGAAGQPNVPGLLAAEQHFLKGEVFLKKGDYTKAIECFTQALKGNPEEPEYKAYLAWAEFEDPKARKEAMARSTLHLLEEVLAARPKFSRGFYWLGLVWKFLNESEKAGRAFQSAMSLDSGFIEAERELRLIQMRKGKNTPIKSPTSREPPRGGFMSRLFKK